MKKIIFILTMIIVFPLGVNAMEMDNVTNETYYVKSEIDYDDAGNVQNVNNYYVTEEEYNNENEAMPKYASDGTVSHETTYKKITVVTEQTSHNSVRHTTTLTWKKLPAVRSYDFIAHRFEGNINYFLPTATMTYDIDENRSSTTVVSSTSNSHLFRSFGNGWVAVFDLPEGNVSNLTITTTQNLSVNGSSKVYSTYQHSQKTTTYQNILNTAAISSNGLGGVLSVGNVIQQNFDQMKGVNITVSEDLSFEY